MIEPTAGFRDQVTPVLVVPLIETLNWADWPPASETAVGDIEIPTVGESVIAALAVLVESAKLVAVSITVCWLVIVAGAVYKPFVTVPAAGASDQVTPVLAVPLIEVLNCWDCPALSEAAVGDIAMVTGGCTCIGTSDMVALADAVESARLVTVIVTFCATVRGFGAVYNPFATVPTFGFSDH